MYRECACGCGTQIPAFDSKHRPKRFLNGHSRKGKIEPFSDRFWKKVDKTNPNGCWEWMAYKDEKGYGHIKMPGRNGLLKYAHRVSWILTHGDIPEGMEVCHKCDNPRCVNPSHLFLGSHTDNMRDALSKNRFSGTLSQENVIEIRQEFQNGKKQQELAEEYDVSQGQISRIINGGSW